MVRIVVCPANVPWAVILGACGKGYRLSVFVMKCKVSNYERIMKCPY